MGLTRLVLRRPVATVIMVLCLVVFGLRALSNATLQLMPDMDMPMLIMLTVYSGASAEDVNDLVTTEIEDQIGSLSGIDTILANSMENTSMVMIRYDYDVDIDEAYNDLEERMDRIKANLPDDCNDPMVIKMDVNSTASVMLTIQNDAQENLYNYVNDRLVPEFEKISSVADVSLSGGTEEYIAVTLIPEKLAQYGLTMSDIISAVSSADFSYPLGDTKVGSLTLSASAGSTFDTVDLLKTIPISVGSGNIIYLEDVAVVSMAKEDATSIARYNGIDTVALSLTKQQSSSAMEVSRAVQQTIAELEASDANLRFNIVMDQSDSILSALSSVFLTMIFAVIVAMFVIFLFFGTIRASLIVGTSIPISVLAALTLIQAMGFSLNVVTLSALVLGIGMMVDNSIVVLESCFRATKGKGYAEYREAAIEGSSTVIQSIIGSTITTCVVFIPLAMISGLVSMMFRPLGWTIVFCMSASLISAMTIVPLCYCYFRPTEKENTPLSGIMRRLQRGYGSLMNTLLDHKIIVVIGSVIAVGLALWMATQLRVELMVSDDTGQISISVDMRPGLSIEESEKVLTGIEKFVSEDPDVEDYMVIASGSGVSMLGSSGGAVSVYLYDDRSRSTDDIVREWKHELADTENCAITITANSSMSSSLMSSVDEFQYVLRSTQYEDLKSVSDEILYELQRRPELSDVSSTLENSAPVVKVDIDAVKATAEGITPLQAASSLYNMLSGVEATTMKIDSEDYSVMVEYPKGTYDTIDQLQGIVLTNSRGQSVALTDIANIYFRDTPATITRQAGEYQVTISGFYLTEDQRQQAAIDQVLYDEVIGPHLSQSVHMAVNTITETMNETFASLGEAIMLAVFLVFAVMAMQFESPKFSIMVMTTIPFALIGSFMLLYVLDVSISMVSLLGFLMLIGTVVNNGILYVDTVNQYRSDGTMKMKSALIQAGMVRMRPIFMTTLTTIVAMIPMAAGYGNAGATMQGLAVVDMGGLIASTALALLVLPIYYAVMSREPKKREHYD